MCSNKKKPSRRYLWFGPPQSVLTRPEPMAGEKNILINCPVVHKIIDFHLVWQPSIQSREVQYTVCWARGIIGLQGRYFIKVTFIVRVNTSLLVMCERFYT